MSNDFNYNNNAWLYIKWEFQDEDWNGEPMISSYPLALAEIAKYLNGDFDTLTEDEKIYFATTGWIFHNDAQDRFMFNESAVYEADLRILYQDYKNTGGSGDVIDTLNQPSILLTLHVPCSETMGSLADFPMPLTSFFQMVKKQYEHPEVQIEDIPF